MLDRRSRILHCHSTFALGGKEARAVRLMNAFGDRAEHVILSATDDLAARAAIDPGVSVNFPADAPGLTGKPSPGRYRALARYMAGFDLVLTYNWGAMDAVGARRLFPAGVPPLIHHEDGFNADEAVRLNWKRNAFRRLMLPAAQALVVPSVTLETIARDVWQQRARTHRIANGIPTARYAAPPLPDAIPGFARRDGEVVVGTIAGLRAVKNLPRLVRAVAGQPPHVRLIIVGEGPERERILAEAAAQGIADRVHLPGFLPDPWRYIGLFDIMALSSFSEQQPIAIIEAMAAGLPVTATDVGDIQHMLATENRDFIGSDAALDSGLARLAANPALRRTVGSANQLRAATLFDETSMIAAYAGLYARAMGVSPQSLWPTA
jgi:glycosyltransferase involved in cell wall biosynthesis